MSSERSLSPIELELLKLIMENPLESSTNLLELWQTSNLDAEVKAVIKSRSSMYRYLKGLFEKYSSPEKAGGQRIQVIDWELFGLYPTFVLTEQKLKHPYAINQFTLIGSRICYLTLLISPQPVIPIPANMGIFPITKIHPPTNNLSLLRVEQIPETFAIRWLSELKGLVQYQLGDTTEDSSLSTHLPLEINGEILETLSILYNFNKVGRPFVEFERQTPLNEEKAKLLFNCGVITPYLDLHLMNDQIVILEEVADPSFFRAGLQHKFPLTELYETNDTIICRFQSPIEMARLELDLLHYLSEMCYSRVFFVHKYERMFNPTPLWKNDRWIPFSSFSF